MERVVRRAVQKYLDLLRREWRISFRGGLGGVTRSIGLLATSPILTAPRLLSSLAITPPVPLRALRTGIRCCLASQAPAVRCAAARFGASSSASRPRPLAGSPAHRAPRPPQTPRHFPTQACPRRSPHI